MLNISDDTFYFCTFNQHSKVDPVIFDRWMSILRRTPHAKLWMQQVQPVSPRRGCVPPRIRCTRQAGRSGCRG